MTTFLSRSLIYNTCKKQTNTKKSKVNVSIIFSLSIYIFALLQLHIFSICSSQIIYFINQYSRCYNIFILISMKYGIPDHVVRALDLRDNSFLDSFVEVEREVELEVVLLFLVVMVDVNSLNPHAIKKIN